MYKSDTLLIASWEPICVDLYGIQAGSALQYSVLEQQPGALQTQAALSWLRAKAELNLGDLILIICTGIMPGAELLQPDMAIWGQHNKVKDQDLPSCPSQTGISTLPFQLCMN